MVYTCQCQEFSGNLALGKGCADILIVTRIWGFNGSWIALILVS